MASIPPTASHFAKYGGEPADKSNIPANPLSIGPYTFLNDEAPADIEFGLAQKAAEHELIGGGVQVQCLGAFAKDVIWTGMLRDNARARARSFKALAATGQVYSLSYIDDVYDVIVKEFIPKHYFESTVGYSITVRVLRDRSGQNGQAVAPTVNDQVLALYSECAANAQALIGQDDANDPELTSALNELGADLEDADLSNVAMPKKQSILASVQSALGTAQKYLNSPAAYTVSQTAAANRIVNGLTVISKSVTQGQASNTITVNGGSLYKIAALYGGTPSYARQIAQANGLTSLKLEQGVVRNLVLPPKTS